MTKPPKNSVRDVLQELDALSDPKRAMTSQNFFKTGPGEYSEGDLFLGIRVPDLRKLATSYTELPLKEIVTLLRTKPHEARLVALLILVHRFRRADTTVQKEIYTLYLANTDKINNWDLVDLSAEHIVGAWLSSRSKNQSMHSRIHRHCGNAASLYSQRFMTLKKATQPKRSSLPKYFFTIHMT